MQQVDAQTVSIAAGLLLANIGALVGFFVSLKVDLARAETKIEALEKDINNLGALYRAKKEGV